jgi:hypothetical protein
LNELFYKKDELEQTQKWYLYRQDGLMVAGDEEFSECAYSALDHSCHLEIDNLLEASSVFFKIIATTRCSKLFKTKYIKPDDKSQRRVLELSWSVGKPKGVPDPDLCEQFMTVGLFLSSAKGERDAELLRKQNDNSSGNNDNKAAA